MYCHLLSFTLTCGVPSSSHPYLCMVSPSSPSPLPVVSLSSPHPYLCMASPSSPHPYLCMASPSSPMHGVPFLSSPLPVHGVPFFSHPYLCMVSPSSPSPVYTYISTSSVHRIRNTCTMVFPSSPHPYTCGVPLLPLPISSVQRFMHEDRLPHLLFYGPPGTGKTSTILACAKTLYSPREFNSMVLEVRKDQYIVENKSCQNV